LAYALRYNLVTVSFLMKVEQFKKLVGVTLLTVFVGGAIYKIGENSDSIVLYLFVALIMLFIVWGVVRLLSEY